MEEKIYLALLHSLGINQGKLHLIFYNNCNYKAFYDKLSTKKLQFFGFTDKQSEFILKNKDKLNLTDIKNKLLDRDVQIITILDDNYPEYLKEIPNPPYLFYLRGNIDNSPKISVVGARKITSYGESVIDKIVGDLAKYFVIVSGGAAGCDTRAHEVALNYSNKTISIIGTGIDIDYPVGNKRLYDKIANNGGGVISIFPIGEVGNPYNFPIRNELVAGISSSTLVIEAKKKSGTLITANLALDMGRDLFCIPGDIFKINSEGCNNLIKKGNAKLVNGIGDILEEYNIGLNKTTNNIKNINFIDDMEKEIYNLLILEALSINEIIQKLGINIKTLGFKLSMMEVNGYIKKSFAGKYEVF